MKTTVAVICLCLLLTIATNSIAQDNSATDLSGPYLGQKPPGMTPEIFAPGVISTDSFEFGSTWSPDGKEVYFTRRATYQGAANRIYYTTESDGVWTEPKLAPFAKDIFEFTPRISPDGNKVFYYSERPHPATDNSAIDGDLWYCVKNENGWSQPQYLKATANKKWCMTVSIASNGNIYYSGAYNGKMGVHRSTFKDGVYSDPEFLPEEINYLQSAHPFIAPDESYLIFDSQVSGRGKPELYISFRKPDGSWTKAKNMGPSINATKTEFAASVTPDGKYMFFHRRVEANGDIYWVDAEVIEKLRIQEIN